MKLAIIKNLLSHYKAGYSDKTLANILAGKHTNELLLEAACCAWEAMLEGREKIAGLDSFWKEHGTVQLRRTAMALAPVICDAYDIMGDREIESRDLIPYDWEFVPACVRTLTWTGTDSNIYGSIGAIPNAAAMVDAIRAANPVRA